MNSYGDGNKYRGVGTSTLITKEILRSSEPVAWMYINNDNECEEIGHATGYGLEDMTDFTPLYTHPQSDITGRLLIALHDAINRPKGVVPVSAEEFYDPKTCYGDIMEVQDGD